jgi:hypothetical protein
MSVSNGVIRQRGTVEVVAAARVLTSADSGLTLALNAAAGAAITLPALEAGLNFKIKVQALFATTAWTIVCPSAIGQGGAIVNSVFVPAANETTITIAHAADTIGDYLDIECDGVNYYINGVGAQAASITFA